LAEWIAFDGLYPIGEQRADFRTSYLATIITNLVIGIHGKKGARTKEVKDFLLDWDTSKPKGTQSPEDMKRIFQGIAATMEKEKNNNRDNKRIPKSLQK